MHDATVRRLSDDPAADAAAWGGVCELCCQTGNNGAPIDRVRWEFFPRAWIDPYRIILPHWTYVAESETNVVGYLTGCPDTKKFSRERASRATLPLLIEIFCGRFRGVPGTRSYARQALGLASRPEGSFSRALYRSIEQKYPGHLHVNIASAYRRSGLGRRLTENYFADLRYAGVPGVHLFCGADPVPFYRNLGFEILDSVEFSGMGVFVMARLI